MPEPIVIVFQTWARTEYALRTIAAAREHLHYPDLRWYVADDGSQPAHIEAVLRALDDTHLIGMHSERVGYGANANAAWTRARDVSRLSFWLEDDWELRAPLDLYPYAALLMERYEIGMVRLGVLNLDIRGRSWGHDGRVYWTLDRTPHLEGTPVFTGHPALRHTRYHDAHGDYPEGLAPGDTELAYALRYRILPPEAPAIVWPADYPAAGLFGHIGAVKTETLL